MMQLAFCVKIRATLSGSSAIGPLDYSRSKLQRTFVGAVLQLERGDLTLPVATVLLAHDHGRSLRSSPYLAAIRAISIFHSGRARAGTVTSVLAAR